MDACSPAVQDRTDRCPGVLRLHEAADGWLARVRLPGGRISSRGLLAVARVADGGNGLVELTSRASLQIRGLTSAGGLCAGELQAAGGVPRDSGARAAELLAAGGLLPSLEHDRVRNVVASPVAGRHPGSACATDEVVSALDRGLCADARLASLPGRFLFAVDDGSGLADPPRADVALVADERAPDAARRARGGGQVNGQGRAADARGGGASAARGVAPDTAFRLWLGGVPTTLTAAPLDAPSLALRAARAFLDARAADGDAAWRLAAVDGRAERIAQCLGGDLAAEPDASAPVGGESVAPGPASRPRAAPASRAFALAEGEAHSPGPVAPAHDSSAPVAAGLGALSSPRLPVGSLAQSDGQIAITVLPPLGRLDRDTVRGLAALVAEVRLSAARTLTIVDVAVDDVAALTGALAALGLVTSAGSGWDGLSACAGLGACASARVDVRAAAARRARVRGAGAPAEHWSACERGCGRPAGVPVAITATAEGLQVGDDRSDDVAGALALLGAGR